MKVAEWKRVVRPLIPADGPWEFHGSLLYKAPVRRILHGVMGEGSGFDKGAFIRQVTMPMYVPSEGVIDLSWSPRIGGGAYKFTLGDLDKISRVISAGILGVSTDEEAVRNFAALEINQPNFRNVEVAAYSSILEGDTARAKAAFDHIAKQRPEQDWGHEVLRRAAAVHELLDQGGLDEAVRFLDAQAATSAAHLGLVH